MKTTTSRFTLGLAIGLLVVVSARAGSLDRDLQRRTNQYRSWQCAVQALCAGSGLRRRIPVHEALSAFSVEVLVQLWAFTFIMDLLVRIHRHRFQPDISLSFGR